ncbi:MAG: hypothetical protein JNM70_21900, partial [Anaerolineae bacterium]|nr:hypothetical protein [Anaerolineae bacterium]
CRELGLEIIEADALDYLRNLKSNSLGAVTGMHIIEHIPFKRLIALLDDQSVPSIADSIHFQSVCDFAAEALERIGTEEALAAVKAWRKREGQANNLPADAV